MRWVAALWISLFCGTAWADATLSVALLPTRAAEGHVLSGRVLALAAPLARHLGARMASAPAIITLASRIADSHRLKQQGALDDAAVLLDRAIEEGTRSPHALDDPEALLVGLIRRATIALARGEAAVARNLVTRFLRYDPRAELTPLEKNPQLQALLDDVRRDPGSSAALDASDLGEACRGADIVIVARRDARAPSLELTRFDHCREISRAHVALTPSAKDDDAAIDELTRAAYSPASTRVEGATHPRASGRNKKIIGAVLVAVGAALVAPGIYFAVRAASSASAANDGCSALVPCTGSQLANRQSDYLAASVASGVLLPLGAASAVAGGVLLALGVRAEHR